MSVSRLSRASLQWEEEEGEEGNEGGAGGAGGVETGQTSQTCDGWRRVGHMMYLIGHMTVVTDDMFITTCTIFIAQPASIITCSYMYTVDIWDVPVSMIHVQLTYFMWLVYLTEATCTPRPESHSLKVLVFIKVCNKGQCQNFVIDNVYMQMYNVELK